MRVLFITGRMLYPFIRGGDGTTIDEILSALELNDCHCFAMGKLYPERGGRSIQSIYETLKDEKIEYYEDGESLTYNIGYHCLHSKMKDFGTAVDNVIKAVNPDVVLTQLENSNEVISKCRRMKIPSILYIHDATLETKKSLIQIHPDYIFYNSNFIKSEFLDFGYIPNSVVYPIVSKNKYFVADVEPKYVTFVNPTPQKGILVLLDVCKKMPLVDFQIISGWNKSYFDNIELGNVSKISFGGNMKSAYSKSKLVVVPSQWLEPFCRIPIEAGFSGIASIGSRVGGLLESIGDVGVLVDDYKNSDSWVQAIYSCINELPNRFSIERIKQHSNRFEVSNTIKNIKKLLEDVVY